MEGSTKVQTIRDPGAQFQLCRALGYQSSDLLQANCIVWVEGPSDRLYLTHWLSEIAAELVEGIHYSVMFYGGRLLAHLSAMDPELTEFISLVGLNRNMAVLMDSDRTKSGERLNATKLRVRREVSDGDGLVWVTDGREIENYYPPQQLMKGVREVSASARLPRALDKYADIFRYSGKRGGVRIDKIKLARKLTAFVTPDHLDLHSQLRGLAQFVRDASDLA